MLAFSQNVLRSIQLSSKTKSRNTNLIGVLDLGVRHPVHDVVHGEQSIALVVFIVDHSFSGVHNLHNNGEGGVAYIRYNAV